ncbi:hypothetical protein MBLNU457_6989t1 [Dothideomycetes sp. NU457]
MRPTIARLAQYGTQFEGHHGMQPWAQLPEYKTYKSKYGPQYQASTHFHGINLSRAYRFGMIGGGFAGVAGIFALFFFGEVPKVRKDILSKVPVIGGYFIREIPADENPF